MADRHHRSDSRGREEPERSGHRRSDSRGRDSRDSSARREQDSSRGRDYREGYDGGRGRDKDRGPDDGRERRRTSGQPAEAPRPPSAGKQPTPTKPPSVGGAPPRAAAGSSGGGALFSGVGNLLKSAIEDARRRAAGQDGGGGASPGGSSSSGMEEGEAAGDGSGGGGGSKRRRHSPITWSSPKRRAAEAADDGSGRPQPRPASGSQALKDRVAAEAEEFRRLQEQQAAGAAEVPLKSSPSVSEEEEGGGGDARGDGGGGGTGSAGGGGGTGGRRWHENGSGERGEGGGDSGGGEGEGGGGGGGAGRRSRWLSDEEEEEVGGGRQKKAGGGGQRAAGEEGDAPAGDDEDAIMRELNRREREDLEHAGGAAGDASGTSTPDSGAGGRRAGGRPLTPGGSATPGRMAEGGGFGAASSEVDRELEGRPFEKNMMEECRSVDEYEKLNRISEGAYGVVFRAREKKTGRIFALKKIKLDHFKDGFPQTSIREINVLLSLHHPNIVNVTEVVVGSGGASVFMVMEFVEHDLRALLDKELKKSPLSTAQVKGLMQQLLRGIAYLHEHWVIHRDLKTSNLLYGNDGTLKICDFGMARQYGSPLRQYTPMVVTLWYRSIERLLGEDLYSTALDMWSVGCIMAELLSGTQIFQGKGEIDQVKQIFNILGTPTNEDWPGWDKLPFFKTFKMAPGKPSVLRQKFPRVNLGAGPMLSDAGFDLLSRLLALNPAKRLSAKEALEHGWFREGPLPAPPHIMPTFPSRAAGEAGGR